MFSLFVLYVVNLFFSHHFWEMLFVILVLEIIGWCEEGLWLEGIVLIGRVRVVLLRAELAVFIRVMRFPRFLL